MASSPAKAAPTYVNPVYNGSFPDPFVLKHGDQYFAFCTGRAPDERVFGMLTSRDLVQWQELPGAMDPLAAGIAAGELYWAPEVTFFDGTFYLYYSVGNETLMEIRVATSREPAGPYVDTGRKLTFQEFAIDPHVFVDDDGSRHLFYATDFLDYSRIGTGTVVDRMLDPFTLAGNPRPVTRAKYDWQVYDPARREKGGVRWHTVEGPFVLKRKGTYFEMFSGGNWQNISYGVGYAVSGSLESDEEWTQQINGTDTLPLLRTIPGKVIGPGHNSVVVGPDGRELYCVYHRWQDDKRVMCIDRMDITGDRLFVAGPSFEPQRAPYTRSEGGFKEDFEIAGLSGRGWSVSGDIRSEGSCLVMSGDEKEPARLIRTVPSADHELALNLRIDDATSDTASITIAGSIALRPEARGWIITAGTEEFALTDLELGRYHQVRAVCEFGVAMLFFDGRQVGIVSRFESSGRLEIAVHRARVTLDMVRFTLL